MAGWTFLVPICWALKWRPHIWITGTAGSGKSTIQRGFCCGLIDEAALYAQGNSTEPGIRQELEDDSLTITRELKAALELVDVRVLDHFIVAGTQTVSMAEGGLL